MTLIWYIRKYKSRGSLLVQLWIAQVMTLTGCLRLEHRHGFVAIQVFLMK